MLKGNKGHWFALHSSVSSWHHVSSAQEILSLPSKPECWQLEGVLLAGGGPEGGGEAEGTPGRRDTPEGTGDRQCLLLEQKSQPGPGPRASLHTCLPAALPSPPSSRGTQWALCALSERPGFHHGSKSLSAAGA